MRTFTLHKQKPIQSTMKTDAQNHTPGPWFIETYKSPNCYPSVKIRSKKLSKYGSEKFICDMPDQTGEEPPDFNKEIRSSYYSDPIQASENLSNARLISSAPDLLSALEFLLADYLAIGGESLTGSSVPADKAREALRKAKGEA